MNNLLAAAPLAVDNDNEDKDGQNVQWKCAQAFIHSVERDGGRMTVPVVGQLRKTRRYRVESTIRNLRRKPCTHSLCKRKAAAEFE